MLNTSTLEQKVAIFEKYSREIERVRNGNSRSWNEKYLLISMLEASRVEEMENVTAAQVARDQIEPVCRLKIV